MSVTRRIVLVGCAAAVASAAIVTGVSCKHGEYDGSYDGSFDAGPTLVDGSTVSHLVQPDKTETVTSSDNAFDLTFAVGTFANPSMVTITTVGERTLDTGLIVPIYLVTSSDEAEKVFQASFHGAANQSGPTNDRALVPALQAADTWQPLAVVGTPNKGGATATFWGLGKTFGAFSLAYVNGIEQGAFAETATSCTSQCCHPTNGSEVAGFAGGCFCATDPDLACFLEHCPDLAPVAARCSAVAAGNNGGAFDCKPFGASNNCPGPGCPNYTGNCNSGTTGTTGNNNVCCIINKNSGSCVNATCPGFAARCSANSPCPLNTTCCVFENESYCAKDCPAAQRACASNADCTDAGADAGECLGGGCPVAVCGTPPTLCR